MDEKIMVRHGGRFVGYAGDDDGLVELANGVVFPARTEVTVYFGEGQPWVRCSFRVKDGRPVLTRLVIDSFSADGEGSAVDEITPAMVRALPVEEIRKTAISTAAAAHAVRVGEQPGPASRGAVAIGQRRHSMSGAFLQRVAEIARDHPEAPRLAVQELLQGSPRSATRWVAAARKRGFLTEEDR